ncbi:MAG TPA: PDZ domain-containing protein [Phycisphaerae bacterium]|nr:PDZ domain-containing protein [Phycisphaerae bacterium]
MGRIRSQTIQIRAAQRAPLARMVVIAALLLMPAVTSKGQSAPARSAPDPKQYDQLNLGFDNAPDDQVEPLIEQLGSPDFETREAASKQLEDIGPAAFAALSRHYYSNRDFEVRLRIEQIVKNQYLWHTLLKHNGFMGVQYSPHTGTPFDPNQPVILIGSVEAGHAAQKAGLRQGDVIASIDQHPIGEIEDFAEYIKKKGVGGKLALTIIRRDPFDHTLTSKELTLVLGARPIELYNSSVEQTQELNARMQAYSIWWEKHFSLPRASRDRLPTSEVLQIPD